MYGGYNVPYGYAESNLYTIGGKLASKEDVAYRLLNYAPSAAEYNAAKQNVKVGCILYGGAAAGSLGSVLAFVGGNKSVPTTFTDNYGNSVSGSTYQHNYTGAVILTGVAWGLATAAFITILKAPGQMNKSMAL
jgi:hypothetical protein